MMNVSNLVFILILLILLNVPCVRPKQTIGRIVLLTACAKQMCIPRIPQQTFAESGTGRVFTGDLRYQSKNYSVTNVVLCDLQQT